MKKVIIRYFLTFIFALLLSPVGLAQLYPVGSEQGVDGKELFSVCAFCHGMQGQGGPALDAPPLAGMEAWYIERQLKAFKNRARGMHSDDVPGMVMSIVSGMARNEATIKNVAKHIESLSPGAAPELVRGEVAGTARPFIWRSQYAKLEHPEPADAGRGADIYVGSCAVCHGSNGEGNESLGSPRLTNLSVVYLHRQLQYFKNDVRGSNPEDIYGAQMASFAKLLADEQAIADVVAYIDSIEVDK